MKKITRRKFLQVMNAVAGTTFVVPAVPVSEQSVNTLGQWEEVDGSQPEFWIEIDGQRVDGVLNVRLTEVDSMIDMLDFGRASSFIPSSSSLHIEAVFLYDSESPVALMIYDEHELSLVCDNRKVSSKARMVNHSAELSADDFSLISCEWHSHALFQQTEV